MTDGLPPELEELERALSARPTPPLPPGLRWRVMEAVRLEGAPIPALRPWAFAAGLAAGALLWLNAALLASASDDLLRWPGAAPPDPAAMRRLMRDIPELDLREARRLALLQAGPGGVPYAASVLGSRAAVTRD